MNREKDFIRMVQMLSHYELTIHELKMVLWRYFNNASYSEIAELEEGENVKRVSKEAVFYKMRNIFKYLHLEDKGDGMNCLDCRWLKYWNNGRKYVYCSAGMIPDYKGDDRLIKWKDSKGVPLPENKRKSMAKLIGCKLFESVKGD